MLWILVDIRIPFISQAKLVRTPQNTAEKLINKKGWMHYVLFRN